MKKSLHLRFLALAEAILLTAGIFTLPLYGTEAPESLEIEDCAEKYDANTIVLPDTIQKSGNAQIEALLKAAEGEVGYVQENGISKFGTWFAPGYDYAGWCAIFVAWCGDQAGIPTSVIARMATTDGGWYAEHGTVHYFFDPWINCYNQNIIVSRGIKCTRTEYIPQRGDLVYFKWSDSSAASTFNHVGIVCGTADGYVYTVEGNSGSPGSVKYKRYRQTDTQILCYATPDYATDSIYKTGIYTTRTEQSMQADAHENAAVLQALPAGTALTVTSVTGLYGKTAYNGISGWIRLSDTDRTADIPVSAVRLDPLLKLTEGTVSVLHAEVTPAYATYPALTYYSTDSSVARVTSDGGILAVSPGQATIVAVTADGVGALCDMEVLPRTGTDAWSGWMTLLPPVPEGCERTVETGILYRKVPASGETTEKTVTVCSDWSDTLTSRDQPVESSTLRITGTTTMYVYYHYHNVYDSGINGIDSIPLGASPEYDEITLNRVLPLSGMHDMGGQQAYYDENYDCGRWYRSWFLKESYPVYTYQTCEQTEITVSVPSGTESPWSEIRPEPSDGELLEQISVYRSYDRKVASIAVSTLPGTTDFVARKEPDFTGLAILVRFSDGSSRTIQSGFAVTGFDPDTEGTQTLTISYFGQTTTFQVTVTDPDAAKIGGTGSFGIWKETVLLKVPVTSNHGILAYTVYLDCDTSALQPGIPATDLPGVFTYSSGGGHTLTVTFRANSVLSEDTVLFTLPVTILRTADTGKTYPITITYDASSTLRDENKPVRLVPVDLQIQVHPETAHSLTVTGEQAPTCTENGWRSTVCSVCDETFTEVLPATGHSYRDTVTPPTETEPGSTTHVCTVCHDTYTDEEVPPLGFPVTFLSDDGSVFKTFRVQNGDTVILPSDCPVKAPDTEYDYVFTAWVGYTPGMKVTGALTFQASFAKSLRYPSSVSSSVYEIENGTLIRKIPLQTSVSSLLSNTGEKEYIQITAQNGAAVTSSVGSGMSLQLVCGEKTVQTLTIVVTGDLSGDGKLSITDFVLLRSHLLGKSPLSGALLEAADLNGDGKVSITDYVLMKSVLLGKSDVTPH